MVNSTPAERQSLAQQKNDPNRTLRTWRANNYPKQQWYMIGIFIFLIACYYFGQLIYAWNLKRSSAGRQSEAGEPARGAANNKSSIRRLPFAIANTWRIIFFRFTVPLGWGHHINFAEVAIAAGYILAMLIWEFINSKNITTGEKIQHGYYGNRAGNIAVFQMPLMVLLAGKNNLITLVTGISYEKTNFLHRLSARMCFILVLIHTYGRSLPYTALALLSSRLSGKEAPSVFWMAIGIAATATWGAVCVMFRPFRARCYDLFVVLHFVFVLFTIIGSYYHTIGGHGFGWIFYPTFVFWAFDRFVRVIRIGWNHYRSATSAKAYGDILGDGSVIRLTLRRKITWKAGHHFLISMPTISTTPWETHPFTIANIPSDRSLSGLTAKPLKNEHDMVFFIKVRDGFTKLLSDAIKKKKNASGGEVQLPIFLEGPYGHAPEVDIYGNVVLIAGGSGITFVLPILQHIVQAVKDGKSLCRSVVFLWSARSHEHFAWVEPALKAALESAPASLNIRIQLHSTREGAIESSSETSSHDEKEPESPVSEKKTWGNTAGVIQKHGRPDLHAILAEEVHAADERICVTIAGPPSMAEEVRASLRFDLAGPKAIMKGGASVTLNVESFGLA
ncbi:hypothetical protein M422DRAFT_200498 [Sphaerobolus stellatus SS14]|nr:hypothetical protein M422DRAFT_200498 [Sphaerobolus stellatus SS14]